MKFEIAAFTHIGTRREANQDRVLVNGRLLEDGGLYVRDAAQCICYVADGVGGSKDGAFAAQFVLAQLQTQSGTQVVEIEDALPGINAALLKEIAANPEREGATTLTGLVASSGSFGIIHVGDSELWLLRDEMLFKITGDQVLNDQIPNSPLVSYLGGTQDRLNLYRDYTVDAIEAGDLFLLCSDGLFKSLTLQKVKHILSTDGDLQSKATTLLEEALTAGADDNISAILLCLLNEPEDGSSAAYPQ